MPIGRLELFEHELGGRVTSGDVDEKFRYRLHTLHPWAHELATLPGVLDVIEDLIGPDILIYMTTMFIKEPGTEAITSWHQDATYFGLRPYEHVSAWIALSPATMESGCMQFVPQSHDLGQLDHRAHVDPENIKRCESGITRRSRSQFRCGGTFVAWGILVASYIDRTPFAGQPIRR